MSPAFSVVMGNPEMETQKECLTCSVFFLDFVVYATHLAVKRPWEARLWMRIGLTGNSFVASRCGRFFANHHNIYEQNQRPS
jgi:hypothetical protein